MKSIGALVCLFAFCVVMGMQAIAQSGGASLDDNASTVRQSSKKSLTKDKDRMTKDSMTKDSMSKDSYRESAAGTSSTHMGGSKRRGGVPSECCVKPGDTPDGDHK